MKHTRRIISLLLTVAIAISLCGCGDSGADTNTSTAVADTTTPMETASESTTVPFTAGTYESSCYGFYPGMPVNVSVTVSETAMESIEIIGDNMESPLMLRAVKELMIPRMLEHQSTDVDIITGATMTSAAVRLAVNNCLQQAASDSALLKSFMQSPEYSVNENAEVIETDILIVGLGGAGITAALSAAENGASVLAIEKAGKYGGTTCVTGEMMAVNPEQFMAANNVEQDYVDPDAFLADWLKLTHNDGKEELIQLLINESGETLDWMMYKHEWPFGAPMLGHAEYATYQVCFGYMPNNTYGNKTQIAGYLDKMMADYTAAGGKYLLEVEGYELIYNAVSNTVTGVKAVGYNGQEYEIQAKAVVLATGGYGSNRTLMEQFMTDEYYPLSGDWHAYGMTTNDGKLLESALNIGAGTYNPSIPPLSHLAGFPINLTGFETNTIEGQISFFTGRAPIWSQGDIPTALSVAADSLGVNREGERFINEQMFANHGAIVSGPTYYTIWSQSQFDVYENSGFDYADLGPSMGYLGCQSVIPPGTPLTQIDDVIQAGIDAGFIFKANTIEELAALVNINPTTLKNTVDTYNSYCASGTDAQFGKEAQYLDPIADGPYYAILGCAFYYTTTGCLDINSDFQVLMEDGKTPIEGLYAIGTDSMGVLMSEQEQYVDYGGAAASWAFTSGRLVGKALADKFAQ